MTEMEATPALVLDEMRVARSAPAVLKLQLMAIRSTNPSVLVFVFEGVDDKKVYYHWIRRIKTDLKYEPMVCQGKDPLLGLIEILERDRAGLKNGVHFFVDRDFDGLRSLPHLDSIYLTSTYSFENVLVSAETLEELLKGDLHCEGHANCRAQVCELFDILYTEFLEKTRDVNQRIFLARRLGIRITEPLPTKVSLLADIQLDAVNNVANDLPQLVVLHREPDPQEVAALSEEFSNLNRRTRYRGKFALMFFMRWLQALVADRNSPNSKFFAPLAGAIHKARNSIDLDILASAAELPEGLRDFVLAVQPA